MNASANFRLAFEGRVDAPEGPGLERLLQRGREEGRDRSARVAEIVHDVRTRGDEALRAWARELDGAHLDDLEVGRDAWERAAEALGAPLRDAFARAARNIETFHRALIPPPLRVEVEPGVVLERRTVPLARAGVYAPGGRAAYPSSVLMGVVTARAAGVPEIVVCSPPRADGTVHPGVLAAARIGGATRVFASGGAGAIAAMAYGTPSIPACDVVVGPGNHWVNEAKKQVAGDVRIDAPAGPSELLVLADDEADPDVVVREVIAQAEHDPDAAVVVVSTSATLLAEVRKRWREAALRADRREVVLEASATNGALLLAPDAQAGIDFANAYAAEHLLVLARDAERWTSGLRTAGTVFVGASSSVAFGDYLTGANHVLPTGGRAHAFSGLSTEHFLRSFTVQRVGAAAARSLAEATDRMARLEGLPAHAAAARALGGHP